MITKELRKKGKKSAERCCHIQRSRHNIRVVDMDKITETDLKAAYEAGFNAGRKQGVTLGIEMGIQHCGEVMSAELHRFKFPEGHEARWNYKVDGLRPDDNSMFEFTYERYEDRVKKKDAEARAFRARRRRRTVRK